MVWQATHRVAHLEFPRETGLILRCAGKAGPSGCGAASPSQGPWDPDSLRPALSLGGQAEKYVTSSSTY